jgi:hypothetical protein
VLFLSNSVIFYTIEEGYSAKVAEASRLVIAFEASSLRKIYCLMKNISKNNYLFNKLNNVYSSLYFMIEALEYCIFLYEDFSYRGTINNTPTIK